MKVNITKKEYRLLLDMLAISGWVMNSHKIERDPKSDPYEVLEQKFLALAKSFGCEHLVDYDKEADTYYPTRQLEESSFDIIDEFEAESFWDTLGSELAKRDLVNEKGLEQLQRMDRFDILSEQGKIANKYHEEFERHGVKNLILSKD